MNKICAEYIWVGGNGELRSKTKIVENMTNLPMWNFDGSSTGQANGNNSEVNIIPVKICKCPFRKKNNILVLCSCHGSDLKKISTNTRDQANDIFNKDIDAKPWFGIEQEFFMVDSKTGLPLGHNGETCHEPKKQGQYYCSIGSFNTFGRKIMENVLDNMLYAGLDVSGINAEVAPGQWEYQIGPVCGIDAGDQHYLSRYILERTAEEYGISIDYTPKLLEEWNGSGCHINFSTKEMRGSDGIKYIYEAIERLREKHVEHMTIYGSGNEKRLSGNFETSPYNKFTSGIADRGASIRIGNDVHINKKGYFEDRRPASNIDPYIVTSKIFETSNNIAINNCN
jgi:glutamine synthetase